MPARKDHKTRKRKEVLGRAARQRQDKAGAESIPGAEGEGIPRPHEGTQGDRRS